MLTSARFAMPTSDTAPLLLVDTSVAVALVVADHQHHQATMEAVGIAGGAVYDGLVGLTAVEHGLQLAARALDTYRALGVELEIL